MRTDEVSDIGNTDETVRMFLDSLKNCLPLKTAAVFRDGEPLGSFPDGGDLDAYPDPHPNSLPADVVIVRVNQAATRFAAVVRLTREAKSEDRAICESLLTMMTMAFDAQEAARQSAQSQAYLSDALEALPEALAIFDEDERFVFWNSKFVEVYGAGVDLRMGRTFEEHLAACLDAKAITTAYGREAEWLEERLARFRAAEGAHEHRLATGRWVRTQDRPLPRGGRIGIRSDISDYIAREQSFRLLFEANPSPMLIIDKETLDVMAVNEASTSFYGYTEAEMVAMKLPQIRPEKVEGEIFGMIERLETKEIAQKPRIHVCADGSQRIVRVNTRFIEYKGRECILAAVFDMTERFRAEEEMQRTRRFLREVVDHVPVALFVKDMADDGRYVLYNRAGESLFGLSQADVVGSNDEALMDPAVYAEYHQQDIQVLKQGMLDLVEDKVAFHGEAGDTRSIRLRKVALDDSSTGIPRYVLGLAEDVTEQRTREAEISRLALHDSLTGLPNRRLFDERLHAGFAGLQPGQMQAVLFLDLDGFKAVNDTHGHPAGDRLLQIVAERLQAIVRPQDTVARFGGDEFAVTATVRTQKEAEAVAGRIIASLSMPYSHGTEQLRISASVGISMAVSRGSQPQTVVSEADVALYHAKRSGKNRFSVWNRGLEPAEATERLVFRDRPARSNVN